MRGCDQYFFEVLVGVIFQTGVAVWFCPHRVAKKPPFLPIIDISDITRVVNIKAKILFPL